MIPARPHAIERMMQTWPGDNLGLAFERLLPGLYLKGETEAGQRMATLESLRTISASQLLAYNAALESYRSFLKRQEDAGLADVFEATTASRLIAGLGQKGLLDFGLSLQHPYGTPVLPGSSVKGIASSFAHGSGGSEWTKFAPRKDKTPARWSGSFALEVFGGLRRSDGTSRIETKSGTVAFLDAWWVPPKPEHPQAHRLYDLEIVNPHCGSYYDGAKNPPDGMDNPVPFHFLALRRGERFLFALTGTTEVRKTAAGILRQALGRGIGGKTRTGYGRLDTIS